MSSGHLNLDKSKKSTILIAEPDKHLRSTACLIAKSFGWEPLEATRGIHAWKLFQKTPSDAVLADWDLPEIAGMALLSLIRTASDNADAPVVLLSRLLSAGQVLEAGRAGVSNLWLIPMSTDDMTLRMRELLFQRADQRKEEAKEHFSQGKDLMRAGNYEAAAAEFEKILSVYEEAEVYFNMGYIKTAQNRFDEALIFFRKATEINTAFAQAYRKMAECFEKMGKTEKANEFFEKAAAIYMDREMDEEAEQMLNQVLTRNPETINVYNSLGILYRKRGQFRQAAELYEKALKVNPEDENIFYNLSRMYFESNNLLKARDAAVSAIKLNQDFGEAKDLFVLIQRKIKATAGQD